MPLSMLNGSLTAHQAMHVEQGRGAGRQPNTRQRSQGSELRCRMTQVVEDSGRVRPYLPSV